VYWVPTIIGVRQLARKRGGPGVGAALPFLVLLGIAIEFVSIWPHWLQDFLRAVIPFMSFFRVASRWGLIFPQLATILIALSWPELSRWFAARWRDPGAHPKFRAATVAFCFLSLVETHVLLRRPEMLPALSPEMVQLLDHVREAPGTTVLDLPFCLAGGNSVCTDSKCPHYPESTAGACFRTWHDKRVFGIYESRLLDFQCKLYEGQPYDSWLAAWHQERCFTPAEWHGFCSFLDAHAEIGTVMIYPDLWKSAGEPSCRAEIEAHLGIPLDQATFSADRTPGGVPAGLSRVWRFAGKCRPQ
jgi:hypothetical protein